MSGDFPLIEGWMPNSSEFLKFIQPSFVAAASNLVKRRTATSDPNIAGILGIDLVYCTEAGPHIDPYPFFQRWFIMWTMQSRHSLHAIRDKNEPPFDHKGKWKTTFDADESLDLQPGMMFILSAHHVHCLKNNGKRTAFSALSLNKRKRPTQKEAEYLFEQTIKKAMLKSATW